MGALKAENRQAAASILCLALLFTIFLFGALNLSQADNFSFQETLQEPSSSHIFGTDNYGRDIFALTCSGITISLIAAIISSIITAIIAIIFAIMLSSRFWVVNKIAEVITNAVLGIPHLILMILISFSVGKGASGVILATALTHWATLSKVLSNELKQIYVSNWYAVEKKLAKNRFSLFASQILPSTRKTILTGVMLALPHAILHESTLTFLGLGFLPETPAIGNLLNSSLSFMMSGNWWISLFEGLSLVAVIATISYLMKRLDKKIFAKSKDTHVLEGLNLSLHKGEKLFIVGKSGSGKSMLVDLICGSLPENAHVKGNLWFEGKRVSALDLQKICSEKISYIPQSLASLDPMRKYKLDDKLLYPCQMSGGMQRRALINDAIKQKSEIILADEPTANLDEVAASEVMEQILDFTKNGNVKEGQTLVVVTHDINLALKHADRIAIFHENTIVEELSAANFKSSQNLKTDYAKKMFESLPENATFNKNISSDNSNTLSISALNFRYDKKQIFSDFSLEISSNEVTAFFGENGSGKSTLCKILANHIVTESAKVMLNGGSLFDRNVVQLVVQDPYQSFNPSVKVKTSFRENVRAAPELCKNFGLDAALLERLPRELSGGELIRLSVARAILAKPKFLILDESTTSLDVVTQKQILDFVINWCRKSACGLVFVTHDPILVKKIADKVIYF